MATIQELRDQYKGSAYDTMTDLEIVDHLARQNKRHPDAVADEYGVQLPNKPGLATTYKGGLYSLAESAGQMAGDWIPGIENNNALEVYGRGGVQRNPNTIMEGDGTALENIGTNLRERPLNTIAQIAGGALSLATPGVALKGLSWANRAARGIEAAKAGAGMATAETALYGLPSYADVRNQQEDLGRNELSDKLRALGTSAATGAVERFGGLEAAIAGKSLAGKSFTGTFLKNAAGEAGEEMIQAPIGAYGVEGNVSDMYSADTIDQALAGGVAGAVGGGLMSPVSHWAARKPVNDYEPFQIVGTRADANVRPENDITGNIRQATDISPIDIVNGATGVSRGNVAGKNYAKDVGAAYNEPSGVYARDPETQQERELSVGELYERQAAQMSPVQEAQPAAAAEQTAEQTAVEAPKVWAYKSPEGEDLPEPKSIGIKAEKRVTAYTAAAEAYQRGIIEQKEFEQLTHTISTNKKLDKVLPEVRAVLGDAVARYRANTPELLEKAIKRDFADFTSDSSNSILTSDKQKQWFAARREFNNLGKSDAELARSLGYKNPQSITNMMKRIEANVLSRLSDRYRLTPEAVTELLAPKRTVAPAAESVVGLSPDQQQSVIDVQDITGSEAGMPGFGTMKSVGGGQVNIGEKVENTDLDKPDPVRLQRDKEAAQARRNMVDLVLQSPVAAEAASFWDKNKSDTSVGSAALPEHIAYEFTVSFGEMKYGGQITEYDLVDEQREYERELLELSNGSAPSSGRLTGIGAGSAEQITSVEDNGERSQIPRRDESSELQNLIASQNQDERLAKLQSGEAKVVDTDNDGDTAQDTDADGEELVAATEKAEPVVTRKRKVVKGTKAQAAVAEGTTEEPATGTRNPFASLKDMMSGKAPSTFTTETVTPAEPEQSGRTPADILTALQAIIKHNKEKRAVAKSYLDELKTGRGNIDQVNAWIDAVEGDKPKFSQDAAATKMSDAEQVKNKLRGMFISTSKFNSMVTVVQRVSDLPENVLARTGLKSTERGTQAFVLGGKVYLIASNIRPGNELPVLMHELGVHIGMEKLIGRENMNRLAMQVKTWATKNDGSIESRIAKAALARVKAAERNHGLDRANTADIVEERVAYFVEEAVKAGINPLALNSIESTPLREWFAKVMAAVKIALRAMGIYDFDSLTAASIVDLAYGAANLELAGLNNKAPTDSAVRQSYTDKLPEDLREPAMDLTVMLKDKSTDALNYLALTSTVVNRGVKLGLASAAKWKRLVEERQAERNAAERKIDDIIQKMDGLGERQEKVWAAARDMSKMGKWGYKPTWRQDVEIDPKAEALYNTLKADERAALDMLFKHGRDTLAETRALMDEILKAEFDAKQKNGTSSAAELDKEFEKYKKMFGRELAELAGPYVPLQGVGSHITTAMSVDYIMARDAGKDLTEMRKDPKHFAMVFSKSQAEAERVKRALVKDRFKAENVTAKPKRQWLEQNDMLPFEAFSKLRTLASSKDTKLAKRLNDLITELYITSLAESSSRKSELRREGVLELTPEAVSQAFISRGRGHAHYVSVLKKGKEISDAFQELDRESRAIADPEATKVANELALRYANSTRFDDSPIVDKAMTFNSVWMLLTRPMYYLYNMTQPFMMGLPMLAGKFEYSKASKEMWRAYSELASDFDALRHLDKLPKDVSEAMKQLQKYGKLDFGMSQDLGARVTTGQSKSAHVVRKVERVLRGAAQKSEALNRTVMGMSAFRLAKDSGMSFEEAVDYAAGVIDSSQGDYSNFNAPRLFNSSSTARLLTQFRKIQVIQLTYFIGNAIDAIKHEDKAVRDAARGTLKYSLAHFSVLAGAFGLPLAHIVAMAYNSLDGGDDDDKQDMELDIRKALGNGFMADLVTRGAPAAVLDWNVSENIGAGNVTRVLPFSDVDFNSRDGVNAMLAGMMGPTASHLYSVSDALTALENDDYYKALESVAPSGFKAAAKAMREATKGVENTKGEILINPEEVELMDTVYKAMGGRTNTDFVRQLVRGQQIEFEQHFKDRTGDIKREYIRAVNDGDREAVADARRRWNDLQDIKSRAGFTTQPSSQLIKAVADSKKREGDTVAGVPYTTRNEKFVRMYLPE